MADIFISHSSQDNEKTKEIFDVLVDRSKSIFLDFDASYGIKGGDKWEKELYRRIRKSRIMIVALSPNWLDSQWCYKEYCMARVFKKVIIPVVIDDQHIKDGHTQEDKRVTNKEWDGKDLQHFDTLTDSQAMDELKDRIEKLTRTDVSKLYDIENIKSPFPGLRSFNEEEASLFYGRNDDILKAVDELNSMVDTQDEKFLNILGASGVGKSSFLKAGVLPYLELMHKESWYVFPTFQAKQDILSNLKDVIEYVYDSEDDILKKLEGDGYKTLFKDIEQSVKKQLKNDGIKHKNLKLLLPIDQAEEVLTSSNQAEKEQFFEIIKYLVQNKDNFLIVWTLRSDQLKKYQDDKSLEFLRQSSKDFILNPIAISELKNIIQEPAYVKDIVVDDEVVEAIKEDLTSTTSLPLLAYLLQKLYNDIKTKNLKRITENDYKAQASGENNPIESIINSEADEVYKQVEDKEQIKELFINHLVKVNIDTSTNKKSAKLTKIPKELHPIIEEFVKKRLLINDGDEQSIISIEIAHEALLNSWAKLKKWIDNDKEALLAQTQLRVDLNLWKKSNESPEALLTGIKLQNMTKYIKLNSNIFSEEEKRYVRKSVEEKEAKEHMAKEQAEREKKLEQKSRRVFLAGTVASVSLAALSSWKWWESEKSKKVIYQKSLALQEEVERSKHNIGLVFLAKAQKSLSKKDYIKANLFSYKALENLNDKLDKTDSIALSKSIIIEYPNINKAYQKNTEFVINAVAMKNDMVVFGAEGSILQLNLNDGTLVFMGETINRKHVNKILLTKNKKIITMESEAKNIQIWKTNGILLHTLNCQDIVLDISFSKDEQKLCVACFPKTIQFWDIKKGMLLNSFNFKEKGNKVITVVAISEDNILIAYGFTDGLIEIWDINTKKNIYKLKGHTKHIRSIAFTRDKSKIVSSSEDSIKFWDRMNGNLLNTIYERFAFIKLSKDSHNIIAQTHDTNNKIRNNILKIWDINTLELLQCIKMHKNLHKLIAYSNIITNLHIHTKARIIVRNQFCFNLSDDFKTIVIGINSDILVCDTTSSKKLNHSVKINKKIIKFIENRKIKNYTFNDLKKLSSYERLKLERSLFKATCYLDKKNKKILKSYKLLKNNIFITENEKNELQFWNTKTNKLLFRLQKSKYLIDIQNDNNKILIIFTYGIWEIDNLEELENKNHIKTQIKSLEQQLQAKFDGIILVPAEIPYDKPQWSENHPFHWLDKANVGDSEAMYQLGLIYERDNENQKALEWYKKSASAGYEDAKERVTFLEKWMKENKS